MPAGTPPSSPDAYAQRRGDLERAVAAVWSEVLHLDRIERQENFFELGGHSLLAMEAVSLLNERCGLDLPMTTFFSYPTIEAISSYIQPHSSAAGRIVRRKNAAAVRSL
jgi:acyl carrier protein